MKLSEEERWQLKLIRLANEVSKRRPDLSVESYFNPTLLVHRHEFNIYSYPNRSWVLYDSELGVASDAKATYKWALNECKKKGLIDEGYDN